MSILNDLRNAQQQGASSVSTFLKRHAANPAVLDAYIAVLALVTYADGEVQDEEISALGDFLGTNVLLKDFDPVVKQKKLEEYLAQAKPDVIVGADGKKTNKRTVKSIGLSSLIGQIQKDRGLADSALALGIVLAEADEPIQPSEGIVLIGIAHTLGFTDAEAQSNYGLSTLAEYKAAAAK